MKPEEQSRKVIDEQLNKANWIVQDYENVNLSAGPGVAVREFPTEAGPVDYALFTNRKAVGVIEAKPTGSTLSGVAEQTKKYINNFPKNIPHASSSIPFAYESTGVETFFRNNRDPNPLSRRTFSFHKPETLYKLAAQEETLRERLKNLPPLITSGLRECQIEAITHLENSLREARPRALIQMASGSGKTYTAVSFVYRLIKFAKANRILFLVDRRTLGRQ
ncbi:MAG: DEAD/DEAH box helicase family protein, partial [Elusimicrobiota bacterium]